VKHSKYEYVKRVVDAGLSVLLTGEAGTGKTTIAKQIAEELDRPFSSLSMTKQTSVNAIIGFISINGTYIRSQFREAFEHGHIFLLDELDAADPNVLLVLNTIENGYVAFPDGIVNMHPNFRLIATANPMDEHQLYTGRSKLDFSTLDRYYTIDLPRDPELEIALTSQETVDAVNIARTIIADIGSSKHLTMRDTIRIHTLIKHNIDTDAIHTILNTRDKALAVTFSNRYDAVRKEQAKEKAEREKAERIANMTQNEVETFDLLWDKIKDGK